MTVSLRLQLPPFCPHCDTEGSVMVHQILQGHSSILYWHCSRCENQWAIREEEAMFEDRRTSEADQGGHVGSDRRLQS
jgi:hypothetical protein